MKNSTHIINFRPLKTGTTLLFLVFACIAVAQPKPKPLPPPVLLGADGRLVYHPDSLGNRVPDFSYCGYKASEAPIPFVEVKVVVPVTQGDATQGIQSAIDYVASLPTGPDGFKGAILLQPGTYHVEGRLKINSPGIVLRGSGFGENGTTIVAAGIDRETLIRAEGGKMASRSSEVEISDAYVPVNATQFDVADVKNLKVGTPVFIRRPSSKEWIDLLGMNSFGGDAAWIGWKPGDRDIVWDRTIKAIEGNKITIDAPLTSALDKAFGGGTLAVYQWPARIENIGIENIRFVSVFNFENPKDEEHCWNAISFENVRDAWVRQCSFTHFAGSAVAVFETASRITVEDCLSLEPVSEVAAHRRNTFFTAGQQTLFQRLYAEYGYHDFATGFCAAGPHAFVQCESYLPHNFSGTIDSWASGILFDIVNVDGHALSFRNREQDAYGAGWTAANSMLWQCSASRIECYQPPGAQNWAFGAWGQYVGNAFWHQVDSHVKPRSLFYAQLANRIGKENLPHEPFMAMETEASSSPTAEQAAQIVKTLVDNPILPLKTWIEQAPRRNPIFLETGNAPKIDQLKLKNPSTEKNSTKANYSIENGWLVCNGQVLTGKRDGVPWWSGNLRPRGLERARPAITRYVPGRTGTGYTDDLNELSQFMQASNMVAMEQNYALWYDRRRDDHVRNRRIDGDAWVPFYELPFARSGEELAWDGLSKYDLTKYKSWYWNRLSKFANIAGQNGQILVHHHYFQHNIIEAGAHWVDSPWRTVNNINNTGFTEPPPFAGDKRIFIAHEFYDIDHPVRRELHRKYIRQCLDNFVGQGNVIQLISAEYTGPLHFVQFWIDVVAEWEAETGHNALIGLSTTKDVQDAILADPVRSKYIDLIDIRYWASNSEGEVYAPAGGQNLAPRQHARQMKSGKQTFESAYADVLAYRTQYPDKAVIYSFNMADNLAWAVFMAGGSLAHIPKVEAKGFCQSAATMQAVSSNVEGQLVLANDMGEKIIYIRDNRVLDVVLEGSSRYNVTIIDPSTGKTISEQKRVKGGRKITVAPQKTGERQVIWIRIHY
jgi:hypothetical protein